MLQVRAVCAESADPVDAVGEFYDSQSDEAVQLLHGFGQWFVCWLALLAVPEQALEHLDVFWGFDA